MKLRSDSDLAAFTQQQLAKLYDWILASGSYVEAQALAARPHPDGFGQRLHITTLRRFYQDYTIWLREQESPGSPTTDPANLLAASQNEIAHSIHTLAHSPANAVQLKVVTDFLQRQRETILKERFLQLAQTQGEFA